MNQPVTRPERISAVDLDDAVKAGVERAEQVDELTKDDLDNTTGGLPGKFYQIEPDIF